jgi:pectate lyase
MNCCIVQLLRPASLVLLTLSAAQAVESRPSFELVGFASISAHGLQTTTGGGNAPVISVRTSRELQAVLERTDRFGWDYVRIAMPFRQ